MPKLYGIIEDQVNNILRFFMEDPFSGNVAYNALIPGPAYIKPVIQGIAILLYLVILLVAGLFLWNQGLHVAFPNVVAAFGDQPIRVYNSYVQLIISLVAIMMIL